MTKKIIIITGATGGVGSALSKTFSEQGHQCILLSKNINKLEKLHDEITANGNQQAALYPIDFNGASIDDYEQFADIIKTQFGKVDRLIHCAAAWKESTSIEHSDPKHWFETFNVNLHAAYMLTRACIPLLKLSDNAEVIFSDHQIDSDKVANMGAFTISKDATKSLANVLKHELNTPNVKVTVKTISAGDIRSPMNVRIYPGIDFSTKQSPEDILNKFKH